MKENGPKPFKLCYLLMHVLHLYCTPLCLYRALCVRTLLPSYGDVSSPNRQPSHTELSVKFTAHRFISRDDQTPLCDSGKDSTFASLSYSLSLAPSLTPTAPTLTPTLA